MSTIEDILGKAKGSDDAESTALNDEPETYRPYVIRAQPQMAFAVVEKDGTLHGFQYHTLRHPKHERRDGNEYLSFTADGVAVVMQGSGLQIVFRALLRYTLAEVRAVDGKPMGDVATRVTRLEVLDALDQQAASAPVRLVK